MNLPPPVASALDQARRLLDCVSFDDQGIMVGHTRQGGNGGLLSNNTITAAEELRRQLDALPSPLPRAGEGGAPAPGEGQLPYAPDPSTLAYHRARFERMLADLEIEPASLLPQNPSTTGEGYFGIWDDGRRRAVTPPLCNRTLAEGLVSAIKLAAALAPREDA